ncbi:MAG: 7-carboxy-7-deazaguanine synthase [Oceanobacter sp.]
MTNEKTYRLKEMFYTLQGEGAQAGRASVFIRFAKCNLWNGKESGRKTAVCRFCDTDFVGVDGQNGGIYSLSELAKKAMLLWPDVSVGKPYIVCTGGEPLLQLDSELIKAFHDAGFEVAIETNGTLPVPDEVDWVCLSPKANAEVVINRCDELKLVYPQPLAMPERFSSIQAQHRYLQPMDMGFQLIATDSNSEAPDSNPSIEEKNREVTRAAVEYCMSHPEWKLSLQTHKWIGID